MNQPEFDIPDLRDWSRANPALARWRANFQYLCVEQDFFYLGRMGAHMEIYDLYYRSGPSGERIACAWGNASIQRNVWGAPFQEFTEGTVLHEILRRAEERGLRS